MTVSQQTYEFASRINDRDYRLSVMSGSPIVDTMEALDDMKAFFVNLLESNTPDPEESDGVSDKS